jgi:hypothetical protein
MKTTSSIAKGCLRSRTRRASIVAIGLTAGTLVTLRPVFAQTYSGYTPEMSIGQYGSPMVSDPVDPWNAVPPPLADPALAPAPKEPAAPPLTQQMPLQFVPGLPGGFIEPWNDPAIPATRPMVMSPLNSMDMNRPVGGFYSPVR